MASIKLIQNTQEIKHEKEIGHGSYAKVYEIDINGQHYALKRNLIDINTNHYGNIRELDLLMRLNNHPFISQVTHVVNNNNLDKVFNPINKKYIKDDNIHFIFSLAK